MGNDHSSENTNNQTKQLKQPIVKKALLIGINYTDTSSELNGCINDSENLAQFLKSKKYFNDNEIVMMNDNEKDKLYPSNKSIWHQLKKLVKFANNNAHATVLLFVSYSGHGSYFYDTNGDEEDGRDEVLCPIDCDTNGYITDDDLKINFVDKLPENVKLVMLVDACHSGTMLDLKYNYNIDKYNTCKMYGDIKETFCDITMISGCSDPFTSSDAYIKDKQNKNYEYQGAMTAAFIANFTDEISYFKLIKRMRKWIKSRHFEQIPQLSCGKSINTRSSFLLSCFDGN